MRHLATVVVAAALLMLLAGPAAAHVGLMPGDLAPNTSVDARLVLAHGCGTDGTIPSSDDDALPTQAVTLELPAGVTAEPGATDGWDATVETDDHGMHVRWESRDPAGHAGALELPLHLEVGDLPGGTDLWLPVIQECAGGEAMAWTHPGMAEGGGLPAVLATVVAPAAANAGLPTSVIVTLAVAVAAVAGGVVFALSGRRG